MEQYHGTTILSVRRGNRVALGGDGQVTLGNIVIKATARKIRRIYNDNILAGFAGGTADAFTLFERFEAKLEKHQGANIHSSSPATAMCSSRKWALLPLAVAARMRSLQHALCWRTPNYLQLKSLPGRCKLPAISAFTPIKII